MSYREGEYDVEVCVGVGGVGGGGGGGGVGRCCLARALGDEGGDGGDTLSYTSDEDLRTCRNFQLGDVEASDISMTFTFSPYPTVTCHFKIIMHFSCQRLDCSSFWPRQRNPGLGAAEDEGGEDLPVPGRGGAGRYQLLPSDRL